MANPIYSYSSSHPKPGTANMDETTELSSIAYEDATSPIDPSRTEEGTRNNKKILVALFLLVIGVVTVALLFAYSDTEKYDTTYGSEPADGSPGSSHTPPSPTVTSKTTAVPTGTITTPGPTPSTTASTTTSSKTRTPTSTTISTSRRATTSTTPSTTKYTRTTTPTSTSTTASTTSPRSRNTNNPAAQWRPMNPKTILCTFGIAAGPKTIGPQDGVCDIIIFDFFYAKGRGSFLDRGAPPLEWFINYIRNSTGTTDFGLGIHHSQIVHATNDLGTRGAEDAVRDFWSLKIRHYGLLKFPVLDALVATRETAKNYINLFKKLRTLQEVNRAGKFDEPGYLILGIGLYAPATGAAHGYLREILQYAPIDAVIIRTHLEDVPQTRGGCKITGPNVYSNPFNTYEVSTVEALDYVQSNYEQFRGRSLMVSFSMSMLLAKPIITTSEDDFQVGRDCKYMIIFDIGALCVLSKTNYFGRLVPTQHVMHGFYKISKTVTTYDSPDTIKWKICMSTKRYPTLQFGVALFSLEFEDGTEKCNKFGRGRFTHVAGYWRAQNVSQYMKNVIRNPDFLTLNPAC